MPSLKNDKTSHYEVPVGITDIVKSFDGHLRDIKVKPIKLPKLSSAEISRIINDITIPTFTWNISDGTSVLPIENGDTLTIVSGEGMECVLDGNDLKISANLNSSPSGTFQGIATTATDPGTPVADEWWSAQEVGTYTNFGGVVVTSITGVYNWLVWDNDTSTWSVQQVPVNFSAFIPSVEDNILDLNVDKNLRISVKPYVGKTAPSNAYPYFYTGIGTPSLNNLTLKLDANFSACDISANGTVYGQKTGGDAANFQSVGGNALSVNSSNSTSVALFGIHHSSPNSIINNVLIYRFTTNEIDAAPGIGEAISFGIQSLKAKDLVYEAGRIACKLTDVTADAEDAAFEWWLKSAGTITRKMALSDIGQLTLDLYGSGSFTGTLAKLLGVTSSGDIIEIAAGASGSFTTSDGKTVTVTNGIITSII